jgi:hypothetical protein
MHRKKTFSTILLVCFALAVFAQQNDTVKKERLNHYSFTVGGGWTHYINNLDYGVQDIQRDFAGISMKFYWEPEYRLSLGLETGYYKLFKITNQYNDTTVQIDRSVIPFLMLVRMRVIDRFYLGAGMGIAIINNKAAGKQQEIITKTTSLSNFEISGAYIYPLSKHWLLGGEIKAFHFASMDDWMYSIQATFAVKL